jgi:hypothetical protein
MPGCGRRASLRSRAAEKTFCADLSAMETSMNHQTMFSEYTRQHFGFLEKEFGFSLVEDQYHDKIFSCVVAFQNQWRYVKLVWGLEDGQFNFGVYRVLSNGQPAPQGDYSSDHFYIASLAFHFEPGLDIKNIVEMNYYQPQPQILEEKIKINAELLRKYGKDILQGKSWFDWKRREIFSETPIA